ncbi:MAG: Asp-tRNA(Asn)/Glu-tRNA(Gln) amidotransferase subunit GatB [Tissierellia bacterium]|nr:Asp-tRNA(Asn)/Glu-tRNA(Gln) amidotransferase subunit GatB [Tissierellia bacterium]
MKTLIGLEIHVELKTNRKMFCNCTNAFGDEPNTNVCPVCLGFPGALPIMNKEAILYAIRAGLAMHADISPVVKMDRKNYFYPDLAKGYQISQEDRPLCAGGFVPIEVEGEEPKKIGLIRIHMEEDTGKALHRSEGYTLMDYNRCGVPLIEIVTEPHMNSGKEARAFIEKLREILTALDISDCKMEEGSLRCDCNINMVGDDGQKTAITEVKNIGSTRGVELTVEYEEKRHRQMIERGEVGVKETRRWDEEAMETVLMRQKTSTLDYRFAQEGDIPPFRLEEGFVEEIRRTLPELPDERKMRLQETYGLNEYDRDILGASLELSQYFERLAEGIQDRKLVSNWVINELLRRTKEEDCTLDDLKFQVEDFRYLLELLAESKVNNNTAKKIFREMFEEGTHPKTIVERDNLLQVTDTSAIEEVVQKVIENNPESIEDYRNGKDRAFGFLVGQVMKEGRGKFDPKVVNELLRKALDI